MTAPYYVIQDMDTNKYYEKLFRSGDTMFTFFLTGAYKFASEHEARTKLNTLLETALHYSCQVVKVTPNLNLITEVVDESVQFVLRVPELSVPTYFVRVVDPMITLTRRKGCATKFQTGNNDNNAFSEMEQLAIMGIDVIREEV